MTGGAVEQGMSMASERRNPGDRDAGRQALLRVLRRYGWLFRIRPQSLAEPLFRLARLGGGRAIVEAQGVRLFVDPMTYIGSQILTTGTFERELIELLRSQLPPGGVFLDIGANEGVMSAVAARCVGSTGLVIAVEPQSRLRDVLEINLALNASGDFQIVSEAVSQEDGEALSLSLGPSSHSGGSSLVRNYRWSRKTERVAGRSIDSIIDDLDGRRVDVMKVDVEGYEPEVIRSARASLSARRISCLAVDYHGSILTNRRVDPVEVDREICAHGYRRERGDPASGYVVYGL